MRIGVLGIGGVGSLITARLSSINHEIYCLGSKESNHHIERNGISIESKFYGNTKVFPLSQSKLQNKLDILFITVKGTKLKTALEDYKEYFDENTIAISLLNGLGHKEFIRKGYEMKLIVASIGNLEVSLNESRTAIHKTNKNPLIEMSSDEKEVYEDIKNINNLMNKIKINSEIIKDENTLIWRKLRRLCVISTITSIKNSNIGYARSDKDLRKIMNELINEVCSISRGLKIKCDEKTVLNAIDNLPYDLNTSMQKDIYSGKPSEIDYILKAPIVYGNKLNLKLPTMNYCYQFLREKAEKGNI